MNILDFLKKWTLPSGLIIGATVYLLFSRIAPLQPIGDAVGPLLVKLLPVLIFVMLYITFCKIQTGDLRPRTWHFILQAIRILLSGLLVLAILHTTNPTTKLVLEGAFVCVICPTAAAAPVITERLGGSIASLTIYTILANVVTSIIIPLFFPMVEKSTEITFLTAFNMILRRITFVLIIPLCLAMLTRKFLPNVATRIKETKNLAFYIWGFNLSIIMGLTIRNILSTQIYGTVLALLLLLPLVISILLFSIGKAVGYRYGDSISAGQALGQKNTVVGIWLTIAFLNPIASIAPCAYVVWQNLINAWQLWYKQKYGRLKW
ncbi:transporter [Hoylesella shahii]|uniref:transporter n=1 Tax=Hoylesella shahii TaxID=228603 RepID=UPI0028E94DF9|nr:transporter [Hoylesella shahii]